MSVVYPDGAIYSFSKISPTEWAANGTVTDRLLPSGTDFILQRADASRYLFKQFLSGTTPYYLMTRITDSAGNNYTVEYNSSRQVTKVIEPAGRFFKVTYSTLSGNRVDFGSFGTSTTLPTTGAWVEILSTSTTAYRYVRLLQADGSFGNIAEVEFYDDLGNKLSGTVISPDALAEASKAFDGDPTTGFVSSTKSGSFVGFDLGTAKKIGKVRFLSVVGKEALQKPTTWATNAPRLQAANQAPLSISAISKVETSDGRSLTYNYTNFNDTTVPYIFPTMTSVSYGDGTTTTYKYGQAFSGQRPLVVEWDDARYGLRQNRYKTVYQSNLTSAVLGMVDSQVNLETGNKILSIGVFGNNLHKPSVTYANGGVEVQEMNYPTGRTTIAMTGRFDLNGNKTSYTFGSDGFIATETDALARVTSYVWTIAGNKQKIAYPDGSFESWTRNSLDSILTYTDRLGRVTSYTRDAQNRITRIDYPDASYETFDYNSFSQVTQKRQRNAGVQNFAFDARGLLTQSTDALGNITKFGYDLNDRLASITDARNNVTSYVYNERGLILKTTNPDGSFKSYTYNKYGRVLSITNELGNISQYEYDVFNRVTKVTDELNRSTVTTYLVDTYHDQPLSITLPSGKKTVFTYDKEWNLLTQTVGFGTSDAAVTTYTYDKVNNLLTSKDPRGKITTMTYDSRNRKLTEKDPLGNLTSWTYDFEGNVLTSKDALNRVTTNTYDSMNRLLTSTDAKNQTTTFFYDFAGNMVKMVDAKNNAYQNTFDLLNRKTSMIYPDYSKEQYGYDAVSNLVTYTTRAGQVKTSTFDNRNRETLSDWSDSTPDVSRTFDNLGRLLTSNNGVSAISYSYNVANELLSESTTVSGQTRTLTYSYTVDGNRASVIYPGGNVISYDYTNRNQISAIYEDGGAPMVSYAYDLNGARITKNLENGTSTSYLFDDASRLTSITDKKGATTLLATAYTLNAVGNRTAKAQDSKIETYGFDAIDQVTSASYTGGTAPTRSVNYNYDATGNRTTVIDNGQTSTYSANNLNQYSSVTSASSAVTNLGYDSNGNLINGGTIQSGLFFYDAQNRLTKATVGANTMEFAYDSKNRVVKRTLNGVPTFLIYDGWSLIEERTSTGSVSARYVHGTNIDEILAKTTTTGAVYYHQDGLGSTTLLTNATGTVVEKYSYDIFGKASISGATSQQLRATSSYSNRFMFTGREFLKEVGLYDYRNRVYSQELGRFLQTDPIRFSAGDVNIYRYCGNRVNTHTDPMGLCDDDDDDDDDPSDQSLLEMLGVLIPSLANEFGELGSGLWDLANAGLGLGFGLGSDGLGYGVDGLTSGADLLSGMGEGLMNTGHPGMEKAGLPLSLAGKAGEALNNLGGDPGQGLHDNAQRWYDYSSRTFDSARNNFSQSFR